ncbi:hypothetical protein SAMN04487895_101681 [Paenibacillus sophorae]|uniref:Uncharacterized protein n=1 Tax=Paenibacillus sophorae TaxID=1333845 RepID=A0A1H8GZV3_9BACL|nr:hypothetical protein [Paenibacillus sophorae]QWU14375.1 hypothetical protein KP014_20935 [Paenibacillus sophorae]SEN48748.1 hypothetical protein SAMN04487895_101681 [Paenibacillus sophorae]
MKRDQKIALGALALVYPLICLIIYGLKVTTPEKQEFLGGQVDMSLQQGFANWLFNHLVSFPLVAICIIVSVGIFYFSSKSKY